MKIGRVRRQLRAAHHGARTEEIRNQGVRRKQQHFNTNSLDSSNLAGKKNGKRRSNRGGGGEAAAPAATEERNNEGGETDSEWVSQVKDLFFFFVLLFFFSIFKMSLVGQIFLEKRSNTCQQGGKPQ